MFIKAKIAILRGYRFADKVKLFLMAVYSSRPKFRLMTGPFLWLLVKENLINVSINSVFGRIFISLRRLDFDSDYLSMTEIMLENCYKFPYAEEFDIIIDGGGNTGLFSVLCNKAYPRTEVLLFEPLEKNIEITKVNFQINNSQANIKKGIVSLKQGEVDFFISKANNSSFTNDSPYRSKLSVMSYSLVKEISNFTFPVH
jgi:FkbM family methyltransferase